MRTALEIYEKGYTKGENKEYFTLLRKAIVSEFENKGYCELFEKFFEENTEKIDLITYSAILDINETEDIDELTYIPHVQKPSNTTEGGGESENKKYDWTECESNQSAVYLDFAHVKQDIIAAKNKLRQSNEKCGVKAKISKMVKTLIECFKSKPDQSQQHPQDVRGDLTDLPCSYDDVKSLESTLAEMCNTTSTLQRNWVQALESAQVNIKKDLDDHIIKIKDELYRKLANWQKSIYIRNFQPFADIYLDLYRRVNFDQGEMRDELLEKQKISLKNFEKSLNELGLYVYFPKEGEKFDNMKHTLENEEDNCSDRTVDKCIEPGIAKKADDGNGDYVVKSAVVSLKK